MVALVRLTDVLSPSEPLDGIQPDLPSELLIQVRSARAQLIFRPGANGPGEGSKNIENVEICDGVQSCPL